LLYAFRDAVGIRDIIDDWNHTVLRGTRFEGRRLNEEETWERNLEDAGEGGRLRRSLERMRSDEPTPEGRWVLERSARYYDSAVVGDASSPGDPEDGTQEVRHAGVAFPDPTTANQGDVERLYSEARALLWGDYNYPVLGGPAPPAAASLRRKATEVGYQIEGDDHAYFAGYEVRDPERADGDGTQNTPGRETASAGMLGSMIGAIRNAGKSRSKSREPEIEAEREDDVDERGLGNVPLLGAKNKGKGKAELKPVVPEPRRSLEGRPDKSPIMSPVDPEDVKNAMLMPDEDDEE
jgi:hypothetical protein